MVLRRLLVSVRPTFGITAFFPTDFKIPSRARSRGRSSFLSAREEVRRPWQTGSGESRSARPALHFEAGLLDRKLADGLHRRVGFRNLAVHNDRKLDLTIVQSVIEHRLGEFSAFGRVALALAG